MFALQVEEHLHQLGYWPHDDWLEGCWATFDANNDGVLDREEILQLEAMLRRNFQWQSRAEVEETVALYGLRGPAVVAGRGLGRNELSPEHRRRAQRANWRRRQCTAAAAKTQEGRRRGVPSAWILNNMSFRLLY
jgi:hypothetical protein